MVSMRKAAASNRAFQNRVSVSTSEISRRPYLVLHDYVYLEVGVSGCSLGVPLILDGVYYRMTKSHEEGDETGSCSELELSKGERSSELGFSTPRSCIVP